MYDMLYAKRLQVEAELDKCTCGSHLPELVREMLKLVDERREWKRRKMAEAFGLPEGDQLRSFYEAVRQVQSVTTG